MSIRRPRIDDGANGIVHTQGKSALAEVRGKLGAIRVVHAKEPVVHGQGFMQDESIFPMDEMSCVLHPGIVVMHAEDPGIHAEDRRAHANEPVVHGQERPVDMRDLPAHSKVCGMHASVCRVHGSNLAMYDEDVSMDNAAFAQDKNVSAMHDPDTRKHCRKPDKQLVSFRVRQRRRNILDICVRMGDPSATLRTSFFRVDRLRAEQRVHAARMLVLPEPMIEKSMRDRRAG